MKARDVNEKVTITFEAAVDSIVKELAVMQTRLLEKARAFLAENSHTHIDTMEQLEQHLKESEHNETIPGWILAGWCGDDLCEEEVKEQTKFTTRNIPFNPPVTKQTCLQCGKEAKHTVWFARSY